MMVGAGALFDGTPAAHRPVEARARPGRAGGVATRSVASPPQQRPSRVMRSRGDGASPYRLLPECRDLGKKSPAITLVVYEDPSLNP